VIFSRFNWKDSEVLELNDAQEAYVYFRETRLNLLTGYPEVYPFKKFLEKFEAYKLQTVFKKPRVFHCYYEFGLLLNGLGHFVLDTTPLVVEIEYNKSRKHKARKPRLECLPLKTLQRPTWPEYKDAFNYIQEKLLNGDCYQVNLTGSFDFETEDVLDPRDIADFFFSQKNLAAYAHATYFPDEMILSHTPECLFHYEKGRILSMPIKGTLKRTQDFRKDWETLRADPKEEGELLMITDLMKNDLNQLDGARAKVRKLKAPLKVPGLLHQYSLITLEIRNEVSLLKTFKALFPGGSITGAPKKKVMEIIQQVERDPRGIYCGVTLLCLGEKKVASINIRTASVAIGDRLWRYGAGGGVTLLSRPVQEFHEMEAKVSSFLTFIKAPGFFKKK
jgi:para-aminobenzoate synthetase component I